jgi:hypothetical protein
MDIAILVVVGVAAVAFVGLAAFAVRGGGSSAPDPEGPPTQPLELSWRMAEADRIFEEATEIPQAWAKELHESVTRDCHTEPAWLDVDAAHRLIQAHLTCSSTYCKARRAALDVLRSAGHYVPAQGAEARPPRRVARDLPR